MKKLSQESEPETNENKIILIEPGRPKTFIISLLCEVPKYHADIHLPGLSTCFMKVSSQMPFSQPKPFLTTLSQENPFHLLCCDPFLFFSSSTYHFIA